MMELTAEMLKEMSPGEIFAHGVIQDSPFGYNYWGTGDDLSRVAVRGYGFPDRSIYCMRTVDAFNRWGTASMGYIAESGDKISNMSVVSRLIPHDDSARKLYRN